MRRSAQVIQRQSLDEKLGGTAFPARPDSGWVRSVRESLGMSLEALGRRLGVSRQTAQQLESAERSGSITLRRLSEAAQAMGCEVVYVLVPKTSLNEYLADQALERARFELERIQHSMQLENQGISEKQLGMMIRERARELVDDGDVW